MLVLPPPLIANLDHLFSPLRSQVPRLGSLAEEVGRQLPLLKIMASRAMPQYLKYENWLVKFICKLGFRRWQTKQPYSQNFKE